MYLYYSTKNKYYTLIEKLLEEEENKNYTENVVEKERTFLWAKFVIWTLNYGIVDEIYGEMLSAVYY